MVQSNLGYPNVDYPKLLGYSKTTDSPDFFLYYQLQQANSENLCPPPLLFII